MSEGGFRACPRRCGTQFFAQAAIDTGLHDKVLFELWVTTEGAAADGTSATVSVKTAWTISAGPRPILLPTRHSRAIVSAAVTAVAGKSSKLLLQLVDARFKANTLLPLLMDVFRQASPFPRNPYLFLAEVTKRLRDRYVSD